MQQSEFDREQRWRLVLGQESESPADATTVDLSAEGMEMDAALAALYEEGNSKGGLGSSAPKVNRWLGDIRKYFKTPIVQAMQRDALDNLGLKQMLLEPELLESVEADVHLVGTLLSLNSVIPEKTKETARLVVRKVVDQLTKKLEYPLLQAIKGALSQSVRNRRPKLREINWHQTIRVNLKHYQKDYKSIIPHQLIGYGRKGQALKEIILCVDQSGSMASSVVYSSIFAAVLASLPALKTHLVVFDTAVADLTKDLNDPVDLLFGTQLGGGTDIHKALHYVDGLVHAPENTILVLISDLYEGGSNESLFQKAKQLQQKGVQFITLLALNDEGTPAYDKTVAAYFNSLSIPVFACNPDQFPDLMATALKNEDIKQWMSREAIVAR
ncbi:MAG: VWA domain-containing protein [Aureispira sp.]